MTGSEKSWEESTMTFCKKRRGSLNVENFELEGERSGSIVFVAKLSATVISSTENLLNTIQDFLIKLFQKCPLPYNNLKNIEIKMEVYESHSEEQDENCDIYHCGRCQQDYYSLELFLLHKESEEHKLRNAISLETKTYTESIHDMEHINKGTNEGQVENQKTALFPFSEISAHDTVQEKKIHQHKRKSKTAKERNKRLLTTATVNYSDGIHIDLPRANDDDYDIYPEQTLSMSDGDLSVNSDNSNSSNYSREDETLGEGYDFKKIKVSYYEKSKQLKPHERSKSFTETQMLQYGIQISEKCLQNLKRKFRRSARRFANVYTPLVQDKILLKEIYEQNPTIYRKALLKIRSSHSAVCTLLEPYNGCETVEISGRSRCGKAFTDDEVFVEIYNKKGHTTYIKRMNRNINVSKILYGKVIGLLNRNRYDKINHPVLVCELDKYEYDKAKPICKTLPKFHLLSENLKYKPTPFCVDIYYYDEITRRITRNKSIQISPAFRQKYLFYVAFISWDGLYPLGAIIKVHKSTNDLRSALRILELQYNVPTLFSNTTIGNVDRVLDVSFMNKRKNRFDLTDQCNVFTIYHKGSEVLEDALSINSLPTGGYRVGVHITDVSSFVDIGSAIDEEARQRGTTFFRGQFGDPHQMLPEPISINKCSLKEGQHKLALSIFYHFDDELRVIYTDTKCCKSVIKSRFQITYADVQEIVENRAQHEFKDDILKLFEISKSLRKRRLGNGMFSITYHQEVFEDEENVTKFAEAYFLIEELMILTNHSVATYLLRQFPDCVPFRCQDPPPDGKLKKWIKAYPKISDLILRLQGYPKSLDMKTKIDINNFNTSEGSLLRYNDIMCVQKWLWATMTDYFHKNETTKAAECLRKEELHPFHALAIQHWKSIQTIAEYRCSGVFTGSKVKHFNLGIFPYAHFTSPVRRYIDIVVHRLLHAAIDGKSSPYSCEDVHSMCQDMNKISKKATDYENQCKSLFLANKVNTSPLIVHAFVNLDNEKDLSLLIPGCSFLHNNCTKLKVNLLGVNEQPKFKADMEKLNAEAGRQCMVLTWKDRIYSTSGRKPFSKHPRSGYLLTQKHQAQKIDPYQKTDFKQMSTWIEYIQALVLKSNPSNILPLNLTFDTRDVVTSSFVVSSFNTENDVNSEVKYPTRNKEKRHPAFVTEQYCNYSMDFHHGQVISVQLSSDIQKGILTPFIQLVDMTQNLKYCLQHMRDPVGSLEQYCTTSTQLRYDDSRHYKSVWIPIILMETATTVIRDGSIVINDITASINENGGCFKLRSDFCFERNIDLDESPVFPKEGLDDIDGTEEYENHLVQSEDYLCIKCHISTKTNKNMRIHETIAPQDYKIWTSHAKTSQIYKTNKNTPDEELRIHFRFIKNAPVPSNNKIVCSVEIMQKPAIDKRIQFLVEHVNRSTLLAKAIALNRNVPILDTRRIDAIRDYDVNIGLPTNNRQQQKAVRVSLRSTFSLIHGPPGTGKTNLGIKLVCLFNDINKRVKLEKDEKKQIIYCGPSNRSVDLVAAQMLRLTKNSKNVPTMTRLYERSIENLDYPLPGRLYSTKKNIRESKADERLKDVTIHHLIRRPGKPYADEIQSLYSDIVQTQAQVAVGKNQSEFKKSTFAFEKESLNFKDEKKEDDEHEYFIDKIQKYTKLEQDLTIKELTHYDVVFCTTAMATNSKVLKEMEGRIYQVIIDECGMCTEPECISTIIATKAKQVVLIGDHKQLQPVVMCSQARQLGLQKSLFERYQNDKNVVHLTVQYRMHPSICAFPSRKFYNNGLVTDEKYKTYVESLPFDAWFSKYNRTVFCQIEGEEEISPDSTEEGDEMSYQNQAEVDQVIKIYRHLHQNGRIFDSKGQETKLTINIMSQYKGQCASIRSALAKLGFHGVNINTVVSSQGGQWDYVIFSLVRSLPDYRIEKFPTRGWCLQNLGFITDEHQINVALTRAKRGLFLIGNKHLLECDDVWKDLIQTYDRKGCVVDGFAYPPPYQQRAKKKKYVKLKHKDTDKDSF